MGLSIDRISILSFLIMMMSGRGFVFLEHSSLRADFKDFSFSGKSFKFVLLSLRIECVFSIDFFLTLAIYRRVGHRINSKYLRINLINLMFWFSVDLSTRFKLCLLLIGAQIKSNV